MMMVQIVADLSDELHTNLDEWQLPVRQTRLFQIIHLIYNLQQMINLLKKAHVTRSCSVLALMWIYVLKKYFHVNNWFVWFPLFLLKTISAPTTVINIIQLSWTRNLTESTKVTNPAPVKSYQYKSSCLENWIWHIPSLKKDHSMWIWNDCLFILVKT